jgi:hypothetical protein
MTYRTADDPAVQEALKRIIALQDLSKLSGVKTYRTVNEILASLPGDVLAAVALELKNRKELTHERFNR